MPSTPQTQIIGIANSLATLAVGLVATKSEIDQLSQQYTSIAGGDLLSACATCVTNADGSLGTADPTPATGHVIDNRVISTLNRANTAYDIGVLLTIFQEVSALLGGQAVTQQTAAPDILAKFVGS